MTKAEKIAFIVELMENVRLDIQGKVNAMPEEWDGHEIREYISDRFSRERSDLMKRLGSRRTSDYRNAIATIADL